ncbi:unnamed protein product [Parascedosporium putredinis]|uniref:Pyrroloquinoline quinone-dependent pyranose dehydrogenase beta-propeller domain-containing protein n=1 Tax=Parascedosporium putredinis TaxID=1442378 RepID=A0A9P1M6X7_9PEZI|nr:unnamed protein product [Parascedosporium putredinis]CAI7987792.1 unnamed protein product [Parascedosporium putredinis]
MAPVLPTLAGLATALLVRQAAAQCQNPTGPGTGSRVLADGYEAKLLINGLRAPRHMAIDQQGNLLVAEQGGGGIRRISFQDNGAEEGAPMSEPRNCSLPLGDTLFASSATDVYQYEYDAAAGTVGQPKHLITGMVQGGYHQTRTLVVPLNEPNKLILSRGSEDNVDTAAAQESTGRSIIKFWNIDEFTGIALDMASTGTTLGWGLRNSVGVGEDPTTGGIWSVENSVDNMQRLGQDVHNENPGEELNYHGLVNSTAPNEFLGKNYGYPGCYAVWEPSLITGIDGGAKVGMQVTSMESPDTQNTDAAAYVSFHGSWNRSPPDGYRLSRIDFKDGQPVAPRDSRDAAVNVMWNANNSACPGGCFRPTGLAIDSEGRIFMSSDSTGEIYLIVKSS